MICALRANLYGKNIMNKFENIIFDLDGTLTDPFDGITRSVEYALSKFGITVPDRRELAVFIGPPLIGSFNAFFGMSDADAELAVKYYRERFGAVGKFENVVYDGIPEVLRSLAAADRRLFIATSKPEIFAREITDHFGLTEYFEFVGGATMDAGRIEKADVISYVMSECAISNKAETVMVGDRKHDVIGAKKNGISSIGVLYGFGDRAELKAAGADIIVETPHDILEVLL